MTLIKSISGKRGIIRGNVNVNLTPIDAVRFAAAYGMWLQQQNGIRKLTVIIGRNASISGDLINSLVCNTLIGLGINVIDIGLSTTPAVERAIYLESANGGIIITTSQKSKQWNVLKLLNNKGECLNTEHGDIIIDELGTYIEKTPYTKLSMRYKLEL